MAEGLLQVKNLTVQFETDYGVIHAVSDVSYHIGAGEIIGLVGESGCGKSISQLAVLQLIPTPPGKIVRGKALFQGQDLLQLEANSDEMRVIRGGKIGIIFQEPMTSLNPVLTIEKQLVETVQLHLGLDRDSARIHCEKLLEKVGISEPKKRMKSFPHNFSGGMRQRIMIAMALSCHPKLVIADEPTTALDVTIQAQVLELMRKMVKRSNSALILVTHNLGIVARFAQRIYVMYAGRIIEVGTVDDVFCHPAHPYTLGLLRSIPRLDMARKCKLLPIPGTLPDSTEMQVKCAFLPRCTYATSECHRQPRPDLRSIGEGHMSACRLDIGGI